MLLAKSPHPLPAMWNKPTSKGTPVEKGLAGVFAVIPEVMTITTLELAKIGLQLDKTKQYNNSVTTLVKDVYKKQGLTGCMVGWQGVQARQSVWTGTYFATLDYFKKMSDKAVAGVMPEKTPRRVAVVDFLAGFFAGVAGAWVLASEASRASSSDDELKVDNDSLRSEHLSNFTV